MYIRKSSISYWLNFFEFSSIKWFHYILLLLCATEIIFCMCCQMYCICFHQQKTVVLAVWCFFGLSCRWCLRPTSLAASTLLFKLCWHCMLKVRRHMHACAAGWTERHMNILLLTWHDTFLTAILFYQNAHPQRNHFTLFCWQTNIMTSSELGLQLFIIH